MQEYTKHIVAGETSFFLGVSEGIKETSVQMLKPEPGKCIDDSLQEVIRRYCVRTPAK